MNSPPRLQPEGATDGPWSVSEVRTVEGEYMVVGGSGQGFGLIACCPEKADAEFIARLRGSGVQNASEPAAWLYEIFYRGAWTQRYSDTKPAESNLHRNFRPLYLNAPAAPSPKPTMRGIVTADERQMIREKTGWECCNRCDSPIACAKDCCCARFGDEIPSIPEAMQLAAEYEAGLRKMEVSGYEEFSDTIPKHKLVIKALRALTAPSLSSAESK